MELKEFFSLHPRAALAYSGGVDSAYLLYAALSAGAEVKAYYVRSEFQPEFEYRDALRLARQLGTEPELIRLSALSREEIAENGPLRCYYCKKQIMRAISAAASAEGFELLIDGSNASDPCSDRPGMRVLEEMGILSPLRLCGLTKPEIRRLSRQAGLFTWDKPAYACLATRVLSGERLSREKLIKIERGEDFLRGMGFRDFRLRLRDGEALLQLTSRDRAAAERALPEIRSALAEDFPILRIDSAERKAGL